MTDKPNYVAIVGKLNKVEFRSGEYGEYVTFSIKQGKHYTNCIASGMVVDALKLAIEGGKAMVYGVQKEKKYLAKDGTEKVSISVNAYAITLDAKDQEKAAIQGETVQEPTKFYGNIEVAPTSMTEDEIPF